MSQWIDKEKRDQMILWKEYIEYLYPNRPYISFEEYKRLRKEKDER